MLLFAYTCVTLCACGATKAAPVPAPEPDMLVCERFEDRLESVSVVSVLEELQLTVLVYEEELDAADAERVVAVVEAFGAKGLSKCEEACKWRNDREPASESKCMATVGCLDSVLGKFRSRIDGFKGGDTRAFDDALDDLGECH